MVRPSRYLNRFVVDQPGRRVFAWHLLEGNFARSFPSWEQLKVVRQEELPGHQSRTYAIFKNRLSIFRSIKWQSQMHAQLKMEKGGRLRHLDYEIEVRDQSKESSEVIEKVEYLFRLPRLFPEWKKQKFEYRLKRLLKYKQEVVIQDFAFFKRYPNDVEPLKIVIAGASGLIGTNLSNLLTSRGHDVWHLSRHAGGEKVIRFDVKTGKVERDKLEGFDVVVNLSGENIDARWTKRKKQELYFSRVEATKNLAKIVASLRSPPKVFLSASAVGYYGDAGSTLIDENAPKGKGFLADLSDSWEGESKFLRTLKIRVVHMRFGMVLSSEKGALCKMVRMFRCGLGGVLGQGDQYMSWVAIDDVSRSIYHAIMTQGLSGPVNIVSPEPLTNREFSEILADYLGKQLGPRIPSSLLRLFRGQMADEVLLSSIKAEPKKLLESGYRFFYPNFELALPHLVF